MWSRAGVTAYGLINARPDSGSITFRRWGTLGQDHFAREASGRHVRVSFDLVDFYHNSSQLIGEDSMKLTPCDVATIAGELGPGFENGALNTPPLEIVPFISAVAAYERIANAQARTKQVLTFD